MKMTLLIFSGLIILFASAIMIGRVINAPKYKIRSETGVQKSEYRTIGGIEQYIQIRGQDISNPAIVVPHGGPSSNMAYYSYEVPVIMIAGDCDWTTPYRMAMNYFNDISAPNKEFTTIKNTGHIPFVDKSSKFSEALLKALSNAI